MSTQAKAIVDRIIDDLKGRRGLRQEWDEIDEDIQEEIKNYWQQIVTEELKK